MAAAAAAAAPAASTTAEYEALLNSIPQFAAYGKLFKSSAPVR
jgi:coatomer protein complex subunit gamma